MACRPRCGPVAAPPTWPTAARFSPGGPVAPSSPRRAGPRPPAASTWTPPPDSPGSPSHAGGSPRPGRGRRLDAWIDASCSVRKAQRRYGVDIGIGIPNTVPGTEGRRLIDWAKNAEAAGFSTLGTIGRLVYPNYEELITLAAAAAVTSRIRLTTSVLLAPLYSNTALFAKQAASIDRLSGGRLVLGLGLGGRDDDFTASSLPTTGKGRRMDEQLTELKRVWAGEHYGSAGAIGPEPIRRGGPQIGLGGAAEASFRRVALFADGWIMGGGTPDMFAQGAAAVDKAWQEA